MSKRERAGGSGAPARTATPAVEWVLMLLGVASQVYLTALLTLLAITLIPLAFGWHSTMVTSGSMEPHISRGDVVLLVGLEDDDPVPLGGIVQFRSPAAGEPSGEDRTRLHRIVEKAPDGTYVTAGDANNDVDSAPLTRELITGQARLLVPYIGLPALWLSKGLLGPLALWAVLTLAALAFAVRAVRHQTDDHEDAVEPHDDAPDGHDAPDAADAADDDDAPDAADDALHPVRRPGRSITATGLVIALALAATTVVPLRESVAGYSARTVSPGNTWSASDLFRAAVYNYRGAILADKPWLYYPLNETSGLNAADASGNGRDGRYGIGVSTGITGALVNETNRALSFYGSPFLNLATPEPAVAAPATFTVELWFRAASGQNGELAAFGNRSSGLSTQYDRALYIGQDGRLNFGILSGLTHRVVASPSRYDDDRWHQVAATFSAGTMTLYVDGVSVGTPQRSVTPQSFAGYWRIGGDNLLLWPNRPTNSFFTGSIDEVSISHTGALSAARVRAHHTAALPTSTASYVSEVLADAPTYYYRFEEGQPGTLTDSSGNGLHTSYPRTGVTYGTAGPLTSMNNIGADFSGFLSALTTQAEHANPQALTVEAWVRTSTTRGGQIIGFASSRSVLASRQDRQLYLADDGRVVFGVDAATRRAIASPASYNDGAWHHVVATLSSTGSTLYVDGVAVASDPSMNRAAAHDGYWITGGGKPTRYPLEPSNTYLAASLDEVAVYPRALTPAQVEAHFYAR